MNSSQRSDHLAVGPELIRRNRRILADRLGWPEGSVEVCDEIEHLFPDWHPSWRPANTITGFERPEGFYAVFRWKRSGDADAYGVNGADLVADIARRTRGRQE